MGHNMRLEWHITDPEGSAQDRIKNLGVSVKTPVPADGDLLWGRAVEELLLVDRGFE